ncbi:hypothetical protein [Stappia sp.]|uniref:hypothetical protein n=1 Tax=Stappia sp. TaxID=1870903 RepID=UPI0025EDAC24|nr:hypothetical protein [Stappia sp.]
MAKGKPKNAQSKDQQAALQPERKDGSAAVSGELNYAPRLYEKRRVQVEAVATDGSPESNRAIIDWTRGSKTPASMDDHPTRGQCLTISTLEGAHWVDKGDYVIRGVAGEFYPCKPDIFAELYDQVPAQEPASPAAVSGEPAPPLFGGDLSAWAAFRATRAAVRGWIGEDADPAEPCRLADQAACMVGFLRRAPEASDEAVLTHLSMKGKARGGDELLRFKVRIFRCVLAIADSQATAEADPAPTDAERAAGAPPPDPRTLSLKTVKAPLALSETAKGR